MIKQFKIPKIFGKLFNKIPIERRRRPPYGFYFDNKGNFSAIRYEGFVGWLNADFDEFKKLLKYQIRRQLTRPRKDTLKERSNL